MNAAALDAVLRTYFDDADTDRSRQLVRAATAEVERLRSEVARLAEVEEALRAADALAAWLEEILDTDDGTFIGYENAEQIVGALGQFSEARAALQGSGAPVEPTHGAEA